MRCLKTYVIWGLKTFRVQDCMDRRKFIVHPLIKIEEYKLSYFPITLIFEWSFSGLEEASSDYAFENRVSVMDI